MQQKCNLDMMQELESSLAVGVLQWQIMCWLEPINAQKQKMKQWYAETNHLIDKNSQNPWKKIDGHMIVG